MKYAKIFEDKYGFDALKMLEQIDLKFLGILKKLDFNKVIKDYVEDEYKLDIQDFFYTDLFNVVNEANVKFPQNQKLFLFGEDVPLFNKEASIPKSKGIFEDFKDIVAKDDLRPSMTGVYVALEGDKRFLVGTDAHILVKKEISKTELPSSYNDKIINLKVYLQSKGKKVDFITDLRYPLYNQVIPQNNQYVKSDCTAYAFYNLAKSGEYAKKLLSNQVFNVRLKYKDVVFSLNPILLADIMGFWLMSGENGFAIEIESERRAIILKFSGSNLGLIMPVIDSGELVGSVTYTLDEVESLFGTGKSTKTKGTKPKEKKIVRSKPQTKEFKQFKGDVDADTIYISRRKIDYVMLLDGERIDSNEMIDGIYKIKK